MMCDLLFMDLLLNFDFFFQKKIQSFIKFVKRLLKYNALVEFATSLLQAFELKILRSESDLLAGK